MRFAFLAGLILLAAPAFAAPVFTTLHDFPGEPDGSQPSGALLAADHALYGTTSAGGTYFAGTVYRADPATDKPQTLYSFRGGQDGASPSGAVVLLNGRLYGTTQRGGGSVDAGTAFSIDPATGVETVLHSFSNGADGGAPAGALVAFGNALYGVTTYGGANGRGTVFRLDSVSGQLTTLHSFGSDATDGDLPIGTLVRQGPLLYGSTRFHTCERPACVNGSYGTLFRVNPADGTVATVYSFTGGADGTNTLFNMVSDGTALYGIGYNLNLGAVSRQGSVFRFQPISRAMTTLYEFTGGADGGSPSSLALSGGKLYGTTDFSNATSGGGVIFSLDLASLQESTLYTAPYSLSDTALTAVGGVLFGASAGVGGFSTGNVYYQQVNTGSLFSFDTASGTFSTLHRFTGMNKDAITNSALIRYRGVLVGTTTTGGSGTGEIYRLVPSTGGYTVLHRFDGPAAGQLAPDTVMPAGGLVYADGKFFGTTSGPEGGGVVYTIDPATSLESVVGAGSGSYLPRDFESELTPFGGLLYGTSFYGGFKDVGTIYAVDPARATVTEEYSFDYNSAAYLPRGGLLPVGQVLYGTTSGLKPQGYASTVFAFTPKTGALKTVHEFTFQEGLNPLGTLIQFGGLLYGTASAYGPAANGTVFSVNPMTGQQATVHAFNGADGAQPLAGLTLLNGSAFGTTSTGGPHGSGTVFHIDLATGRLTTLHAFTGGADGGSPAARLTIVNGTVYGTTTLGGANNRGTVFSILR